MLQTILKAEGNLAISILIGMVTALFILIWAPAELITYCVRFAAAMAVAMYATEKYGERTMSLLKGEASVQSDSSPDKQGSTGGKDQDRIQEG